MKVTYNNKTSQEWNSNKYFKDEMKSNEKSETEQTAVQQ